MNFRAALVEQFHHPRGLPGRLAGWIMATRQSNLERNRWTLDLLDPQPDDQVLELGPGPGITLSLLLERVPLGHVTGLDHSAAMLSACRKANARAIREHRLTLVQGSFTRLPELPGPFDRIFGVNSLQFDAMTPTTLKTICALLKPGGTFAMTFQPRGRRPSDAQAQAFAHRTADMLTSIGMCEIQIEQLPLPGANAICVIAKRR